MTDTQKEQKKKLTGKKKLMIEALTKQLGIITSAARVVGIHRDNHYRWIREDPLYAQEVKKLPELVLDFVEHALYKKIQEGDASCIQFWLKHKGIARRIGDYKDTKDVKIESVNYSFEMTKPTEEVYEIVGEDNGQTKKEKSK